MTICNECGKKLGILEGYYHPMSGKRWLFCSKCYNNIEEKGSFHLKKDRNKGTRKNQQEIDINYIVKQLRIFSDY